MIFILMVVFRTDNLSHAGKYLKAMIGLAASPSTHYNLHLFANPEIIVVMICAIIGSLPFVPWVRHRFDAWAKVSPVFLGAPIAEWVRQMGTYIILMAFLILCSMKLAAGTYNPFIYFKF